MASAQRTTDGPIDYNPTTGVVDRFDRRSGTTAVGHPTTSAFISGDEHGYFRAQHRYFRTPYSRLDQTHDPREREERQHALSLVPCGSGTRLWCVSMY